MRWISLLVFAGVAAISAAASEAGSSQHAHDHDTMKPGEPVPGESLYQLGAALTDQNGKAMTLSSLRGHPTLVFMFYTSCQSVCPVLTVAAQRIEAELTPLQRSRLHVLMITFDPERDTVAKLKAFAAAHETDESRWHLARTSQDDVRDIAAALGVRYRPLPDGTFSHSATIMLLDGDGVVRGRTDDLQQLDTKFMESLRALTG